MANERKGERKTGQAGHDAGERQVFLKPEDVKTTLTLTSAQINTRVGDIEGNVALIEEAWATAQKEGSDLLITPELSITGYPLEDLVENPELIAAAQKGLDYLLEKSKTMDTALIVGLPVRGAKDGQGRNIYNAAVLIEKGEVKQHIRKQHLPNYDVFDEERNFAHGPQHEPVMFRGCKVGMLICEDTWYPDVARHLAQEGAQVLISINASPFHQTKYEQRMNDVLRERVIETGLPLIYVNQVGGQDEIVFDGASVALNANLQQAYQGPMFESSLDHVRLDVPVQGAAQFQRGLMAPVYSGLERTWRALVQGLKDYMRKIDQTEVVLGMSGGIDSAVVAAIAADALGGDKVHLISMPSKFTENISNTDAYAAAAMLGSPIFQKPIEPVVQSLRDLFNDDTALVPGHKPLPAGSKDVSDENLQARARGTIIMRYSNKFGWLPLSTGNKSEVSVGYCTLYGDMNGGFNPLKDVYKTLVRDLATWRNANYPQGLMGPKGPVMPERIITRPPSAELSAGQKDTDSLPEYPVLDKILTAYVEDDKSVADIVRDTGFDQKLIESMIAKVDLAEYKRRQACPGVKITERSFGRGRRYPIARPNAVVMARGAAKLKP